MRMAGPLFPDDGPASPLSRAGHFNPLATLANAIVVCQLRAVQTAMFGASQDDAFVSFPKCTMQHDLFFAAAVTKLNSDGEREIIAVTTVAETTDTGRRQFLVRMMATRGDQEANPMGSLSPADARSLALHLVNAADVADQLIEQTGSTSGVRMLPTIRLCGTQFFIDERLRQLRNVENPEHFFDLDESRMWT